MQTKYNLINTPDWQRTEDNVRIVLKQLVNEDYDVTYEKNVALEVGSGWSFTLLERHGGGEGDGEEHWLVYKLENATQAYQETYWKVPGWYQSYHGAELEWSNTFQVKAVEKVITVWDKY